MIDLSKSKDRAGLHRKIQQCLLLADSIMKWRDVRRIHQETSGEPFWNAV